MAAAEKPPKLTVVIEDSPLSRAVHQIAEEQGRPVQEIVIEALRYWLERQEELEDLAAIREAKDEPTVPWEQVKAQIRAAEAEEESAA